MKKARGGAVCALLLAIGLIRVDAADLSAWREPVKAVIFNHDGTRLIAIDQSDVMRCWDLESGGILWTERLTPTDRSE